MLVLSENGLPDKNKVYHDLFRILNDHPKHTAFYLQLLTCTCQTEILMKSKSKSI